MRSIESWLESASYLPPIMRDFHDAKDVFRSMHTIVNVRDNDYAKRVDWITGHVYVIDVFLWFMAKRGYTLQRSRAKLPFRDLSADIASVGRGYPGRAATTASGGPRDG